MSRFDNVFEYDSNLNGAGLKVGVVMCRFNLPVPLYATTQGYT